MNIFNSLGSNYDADFVWRSIFTPGTPGAFRKLRDTLADHFSGQVVLTYKGRQALELALKNSGLPNGSAVGINGFTCYAVYQAVELAGFQPVVIDVDKGQLDFGLTQLKKASTKHKNLKAIIVQNSLGLPTDIKAIESFCKKNSVIIVEDLAHSFGAMYADGREVGTVGDFTMLSFSQDKPLDVVAGGAMIDRRQGAPAPEQPSHRVSLWQRDKVALYPLWTALIRTTYPIKLGRYIHFGLKKLHLLTAPMGDTGQRLAKMEPSAAKLLLKRRWDEREADLQHRRLIAKIYQKELPKELQVAPLAKSKPSYLRYPILVKDRPSLIAHLKQKDIYIGDTWYRTIIDGGSTKVITSYRAGECPEAEKIVDHIVNLPTHQHVGEVQARFIAEEVKAWLQSQ